MSGLVLKEVGTALAAPTALAGGQVRFETRIMGGDIQGSSGYYPKSVVERDGPKVFHKGVHMHIDHQSFEQFWQQPAGSLNDFAGVIDSTPVYKEDHPSGAGLYADILVFEKYAPFLKEIAPYIGVSIRAAATTEEGENPKTGAVTDIITELIAAVSVDFVTHPGADGRIVKVLENAKQVLPEGSKLITHTNVPGTPTNVPAIEAGTPRKQEKKPMADITDETAAKLVASNDRLAAALEAQTKAALDAAAVAETARVAAEAATDTVDLETVISTSAKALAESGLSPKAIDRVLKNVKAGDKLEEAITAEKAYLAEAGVPTGPAGFTVQQPTSSGSTGAGGATPWATESVSFAKDGGVTSLIERFTGKKAV